MAIDFRRLDVVQGVETLDVTTLQGYKQEKGLKGTREIELASSPHLGAHAQLDADKAGDRHAARGRALSDG